MATTWPKGTQGRNRTHQRPLASLQYGAFADAQAAFVALAQAAKASGHLHCAHGYHFLASTVAAWHAAPPILMEQYMSPSLPSTLTVPLSRQRSGPPLPPSSPAPGLASGR